jgi:hypothetical protein
MNIAEYCVKIPTNRDYCLLEQSEAFMFSFNDGDLAKLNLNLPLTPIRDLQIHKEKGFSRCYAWTLFGY